MNSIDWADVLPNIHTISQSHTYYIIKQYKYISILYVAIIL